jgi:hypothetical protein
MYGAFTAKANDKPFDAVPNQVPLTEGVATPPACGPDTLGLTDAAAQALQRTEAKRDAVPAGRQAIAATWQSWLARQHTTGNGARPDVANPAQMNRYTWYQTHRWTKPYPGDSQIYAPAQVPGGSIPSADAN